VKQGFFMKHLCLVMHHHLKALFCVAAIAGPTVKWQHMQLQKREFEDAKERLGAK
jgi:hypothetical protein